MELLLYVPQSDAPELSIEVEDVSVTEDEIRIHFDRSKFRINEEDGIGWIDLGYCIFILTGVDHLPSNYRITSYRKENK